MSCYERYSFTSTTACSHLLLKNYPMRKQFQEISSSASCSSTVRSEVRPCCSMFCAVWVLKSIQMKPAPLDNPCLCLTVLTVKLLFLDFGLKISCYNLHPSWCSYHYVPWWGTCIYGNILAGTGRQPLNPLYSVNWTSPVPSPQGNLSC